MKTYPYIGKGENSGSIVLFYSENSGTTLDCKTWATKLLQYSDCVNEGLFKNITAEYLADTYGKVESKEHAEFIKLLAGNEGIKCNYMVVSDDIKYFYFSGGVLFFTFSSIDDDRFKLITIPLPPKEKPMESQKEWPQVGDEALTNSLEKVEVLALDNGVAWVKHLAGDSSFGYLSVKAKYLSKPPTPEEELTSALLEYANSDNYSCEWKGFAKSIINGEIKGLSYKPE